MGNMRWAAQYALALIALAMMFALVWIGKVEADTFNTFLTVILAGGAVDAGHKAKDAIQRSKQ